MMKFKIKPFKHQIECFNEFKDADILALLADMGTGKTKIVIDITTYKALSNKHDRMVVIAPKQVGGQWLDEQLPEHCAIPYKGLVYDNKKTLKAAKKLDAFFLDAEFDGLRVFIINYRSFVKPKGAELVRRFMLSSTLPPVIVIDEASRIKNPSTKTAKNIKKMAAEYPGACKIIMTGTPAAKSPVDLWSIYDFLRPRYMGCSYTAFNLEHSIQVKRQLTIKGRLITIRTLIDKSIHSKIRSAIVKHLTYNNTSQVSKAFVDSVCDQYGLSKEDFWLIASSEDLKRFKNLDALQRKIAPDTFQVSKKDIDEIDLPEKIYQTFEFDLNTQQKKLIKELAQYSVSVYGDAELTLQQKSMLGLRVLQVCGGFFPKNTLRKDKFESVPIDGVNAKLNYIHNDIPEIGQQQFVIWAVFVEELRLLQKSLCNDFEVRSIFGDIANNKREEYLKDFKAGNIQGLIMNPSVGGYGLNLQNASVQYWYSRNFRTETRLQSVDRSHRLGITKSPIIKDLVYKCYFERNVLNSLNEGRSINEFFIEHDINAIYKI